MESDWRWWRVLGELRERGLDITTLAERHGYSKFALFRVKLDPYHEPQTIIAQALGLTPQEIWPSRYHRDGSPVSPTLWKLKHSNRAPSGHRQKSKVA
ncbi:MAG: helix-turn-helix domain-containing protein [Magnetospiraceae bacterium]